MKHLSTCVESMGPSETVGSARAALSPVRTLCSKSFGASAMFMHYKQSRFFSASLYPSSSATFVGTCELGASGLGSMVGA